MRQIFLKSVEGWNKLTEKQLLKIATLFAQPSYEKSIVTKAFLAINGLRVKKGFVLTKTDTGGVFKSYVFQKNGFRQFTIAANIFVSMVKKFDWLYDEVSLFKCLRKIGRYPASNHMLFSITLEQFLFAENIYTNFAATGRSKHLRQLVAVFYHPKNEIFDTAKVTRRSQRFIFTPKCKLFATYLWYTGVKRWIMNKYPLVFNSTTTGTQQTPDEAILNLLSSLNQGDITRNETILKTHVHEALYQLNLMVEKVDSHV